MEHAGVVGHSLGGLVGLRLAVNFPQRVAALVLTASAGIRSSTREAERYLNLAAILRPTRRYSRHREGVARSPFWRMVVFGWRLRSAGHVQRRSGWIPVCDGHAHGHRNGATRPRADDPRLDLERVACPVFLLWGARDNQIDRRRLRVRTAAACSRCG